jgi:hypothetical protein
MSIRNLPVINRNSRFDNSGRELILNGSTGVLIHNASRDNGGRDPDDDDVDETDDGADDDDAAGLDDTREACRQSALLGDAQGRGYAADALASAKGGAHALAETSHVAAAKRYAALSDRAVDPSSKVGGRGVTDKTLAKSYRQAAQGHLKAAGAHALAGMEAGVDSDGMSTNKLRRRPAIVHNGAVQVGDNCLSFSGGGQSAMRQVVDRQRRNEVKGLARNSRDGGGGNVSTPRFYDLPNSPYSPAVAMGRSSSSHSWDDGAGDDAPSDANHGGQYDLLMGQVKGGDGHGMAGVEALGLQLLDAGQQCAVDRLMAERLGLDYSEDDVDQLSTPSTMRELLAREKAEGHTQNTRVGDVINLGAAPNWKAIAANQKRRKQ